MSEKKVHLDALAARIGGVAEATRESISEIRAEVAELRERVERIETSARRGEWHQDLAAAIAEAAKDIKIKVVVP